MVADSGNQEFLVEFMTSKSDRFDVGKEYRAKRIFPDHWSWMVMAWDNGGVGRYIHHGDFGEWRESK